MSFLRASKGDRALGSRFLDRLGFLQLVFLLKKQTAAAAFVWGALEAVLVVFSLTARYFSRVLREVLVRA